MSPQLSRQSVHIRPGKPKVLPQFDRSGGTLQVEHRLPRTLPNMHMCGPMIVRVDHDPDAADAKNRGHQVSEPKHGWVKSDVSLSELHSAPRSNAVLSRAARLEHWEFGLQFGGHHTVEEVGVMTAGHPRVGVPQRMRDRGVIGLSIRQQ
jgi:hypothetical protein